MKLTYSTYTVVVLVCSDSRDTGSHQRKKAYGRLSRLMLIIFIMITYGHTGPWGARIGVQCPFQESGSNQVVFMQLDLASLQSVRSFAENFLKTEPRLDILVNNAGVLLIGRTEDGFGLMFGVNHLGHFLLTNLLLDRLKECGPSRVVNVSSAAHNWGRVDFDCLNTHRDLRVGTTGLDCFGIYGDSKLCNALFTHELAKRLKGTKVTCYSLHPGSILTELQRNQSTTVQLILKNIERFIFKTPLQGSQTTLHCALQEGIEHLSGRYFSNCTAKNVFAKARDDAASKKLWEISERFCGI
uniref:Uncharacterized protein n=1 Tax=Xiphophorus couchianus TaxID=32473 RepID=A0A3B5MIT3_9TELE